MRAFLPSWGSVLLLGIAACAPAAGLAAQGTPLPPAGFGTLRQDQIAVRISTPGVTVRALPLDERVIRLLAPDSYASLSELKRSRESEIAAAARSAGEEGAEIFVVTFFGVQPNARFEPDQLYVTSQNVFFRPIAVVPLTQRWSEGQLGQREQAVAIYLFQRGIEVLQPFTVTYADRSSDSWASSLRTLEAERSRALARAAGQPRP